jgi:hypothetical protein
MHKSVVQACLPDISKGALFAITNLVVNASVLLAVNVPETMSAGNRPNKLR